MDDDIEIAIDFTEKLDCDLVYIEGNFGKQMKASISQGNTVFSIDYAAKRFYNPGNGVYYCCVDKYSERESVCKFLKQKYQIENFEFNNTSSARIGMELMLMYNGISELPTSSYNSSVQKVMDGYYPKAVIGITDYYGEQGSFVRDNCVGIDQTRAYAVQMAKEMKNIKIPVLTVFDNLEIFERGDSIECGMYLVKSVWYHGVLFETAFHCDFVVRGLIKRGVMREDDITHKVVARESLSGVLFSNFVEKSFDCLWDCFSNELKGIINGFTGLLNKKYSKGDSGFVTHSTDIASLAMQDGHSCEHVRLDDDRDLFIIHSKNKKRLDRDHAVFYSAVIGASWLSLIDQIDIGLELDGRLIGCNTDATFWEFDEFSLPDDMVVDKTNLESIMKQPFTMNKNEFKPRGELFVIKRVPYIFVEHVWEDLEKMELNKSVLVTGGPGAGKSVEVCNGVGESAFGASFMNSATDELRQKGLDSSTVNSLIGLDENGFKTSSKKTKDLTTISALVVDEIFTTPQRVMEELYFKLRRSGFDCKNVLMGDELQNGYIINNGYMYRYSECDFLGEIVGFRRFEKQYELGKCRFKNQMTIDVLNYFRKHRYLPDWITLKLIDDELRTNIVFTNKRRDCINKQFSNKLKVGDKFILEENYPIEGCFKSYKGIVESIDNGIVNGKFKREHVRLGYAVTSHKYQGGTIDEPYNIHQFAIMTFENQMTALSRCTDINDIHIGEVGTKAKSEYDRTLGMNELVYSVAHEIYEICCNVTKKWYIGITKRGAEECRFKEHLDTVGLLFMEE